MRKILTLMIIAVVLLCSCTQAAVGGRANAAPEREADTGTAIYGKIRSANGNEIVLAIGEQAAQGEARSGEKPQDGASREETPQGEMPPGTMPQGEPPSGGRQDGGQGGEQQRQGAPDMTQREAPSGGGQGGARSSVRGNAAGGQSVSLIYTGEEQTFTIPVTAKITTGSGGSERTLRFTQLAYKNVVKVTIADNGSITSIQVLS